MLLAFIRRHALLAAVAAIGLLVGADYAASVLFAPERAVMHDGRLVFADCSLPGAGGKNCVAQYEFLLGNTGQREEDLIAAWPVDIGHWERQLRLLNIAADEPRARDPDVSCESAAGGTGCRVDHLAPGTLLIVQFRCMPCAESEVSGLRDARPEIRGGARVYRGDPRVNALVRRLQVLFY